MPMKIDYTLYLVTDAPERYAGNLLENVAAAVAGGVSLVQYRATGGTRRNQYETALALRRLLRERGVPLIINDAVDLALAVEADGVHVGQGDLPADVVRKLLGRDKLIGLSITEADQLHGITPAVDYLGIGPVFSTATKLDAAPALGLDALARIAAATDLPTVAIGGINLANARSVFATGVQGIAVVSTFSRATDPGAVARELRASVRGGGAQRLSG